jgi:nicotinamidase-related amidase
MILQFIKARRRQILIDIDTQQDFMLAGGKACIRNHRRVLAHIRRIMAWARSTNTPIISICEVSANNNHSSSYLPTENHRGCNNGTEGQKKIHYTIVSNSVSFTANDNTDLPRDILRQYKQIILHKRCVDPFDEPRIDRLLSELRAGDFILIGAGVENAIMATALGLLQRGKKVTVVVDAVGAHDSKEAQMALRKMQAKGAKLIETKSLAGTSHLRQVGACPCESCRGSRSAEVKGWPRPSQQHTAYPARSPSDSE